MPLHIDRSIQVLHRIVADPQRESPQIYYPIYWIDSIEEEADSKGRGRFIVGAGLAASLETFLAEAEGIESPAVGGKLLDLPRCLPARHGLGVARARVEDHPPEPPGLGPVAAFLGHDGEVAHGEVAVDALLDATELVGTLERQIRRQQASALAGWPALRCRTALRGDYRCQFFFQRKKN